MSLLNSPWTHKSLKLSLLFGYDFYANFLYFVFTRHNNKGRWMIYSHSINHFSIFHMRNKTNQKCFHSFIFLITWAHIKAINCEKNYPIKCEMFCQNEMPKCTHLIKGNVFAICIIEMICLPWIMMIMLPYNYVIEIYPRELFAIFSFSTFNNGSMISSGFGLFLWSLRNLFYLQPSLVRTSCWVISVKWAVISFNILQCYGSLVFQV